MFRVCYLFWVMMPVLWLAGCQNPARSNVPPVASEQLQAEWRNQLKPGTNADRAMAYLLTHGFDCRITRDTHGEIVRILATQRKPIGRQVWQIDLAIGDEKIQSAKITPTAVP